MCPFNRTSVLLHPTSDVVDYQLYNTDRYSEIQIKK